MFKTEDVKEYYNSTQNHYENWWDLRNSLSLHYGIWDQNTKNFKESLQNTNKVLLEICQIKGSDKVLDAGCGVGGAAFYITEQTTAHVTGISLSEKQIEFAKQNAIKKNHQDKTDFQIMDYTQTTFEDESFDVVWACESISSATNKQDFIKEAYRLLKTGGKLILSDFFITIENQEDKNSYMKKWGDTWCISSFEPIRNFISLLENQGFEIKQNLDFTDKIFKSSQRLYYASFLGGILSEIYNLFHPNVSRYAKNHYKTGYYQYKALKKKLWKYHIILVQKVK